jgi:hypothetical protein
MGKTTDDLQVLIFIGGIGFVFLDNLDHQLIIAIHGVCE